jgi:hypothetical protein
MIVLRRRAGEPIGVSALSREGFVWNFEKILRNLEPQASELNRMLATARRAAAVN